MAEPDRICSIEDCGKPVKGRGWCAKHYHRWTRHGDPLGGGTFYGESAAFLTGTVLSFTGRECLLWPFARTTGGYPEIAQNGRPALVHRIACEAANGPPPSPDLEAAHSCGNGHLGCVNPTHLEWKTRAGNKDDELIHGTRNRGDRNGAARLTQDDVRRIRGLEDSLTAVAIGEMFKVSSTSIRDIFKRRTWAWLD